VNIRFLRIAKKEMDDAHDYYEREQEGLGEQFVAEINHALKHIALFPLAWHPISNRTRRCRLRRFSYGIIYQIRGNDVLIVAVAHLHRKPSYWKSRLG